ncbi:arf-GAP domain and FG repeat-containing protein 2 isoform X1 [Periophthalmus magnuspinnatus]|uniref:arf-GAP domain and FG repeat-containing protein 2 isoform X1 n=1 Tax=Periophthalmus magnuspinnatus TaxID=409849 RepID=UPI00145A4725|nr:arf-GAP domain and FG repeat-containing protein 2 isoform X1 [Periophthalmus magnuspinnatus]
MSNRKHRDNQEICSRKVRELAQSGVNKHCFECSQPGVTYTDVTVGSFICTSCSGMLRGLNPPHRVKSISMTTFSQQEVEFLQNHGNEVGRRTWLCIFDPKTDACSDMKDSQKFKEFLQDKYEKKKWHFSKCKNRRDVEGPWSPGVPSMPPSHGPLAGQGPTHNARAPRPLSQAQLPSWDRGPAISPADMRTDVFTARPLRSQSFRDPPLKDASLCGIERQRPGSLSSALGGQSHAPSFPALPRPSASSSFKNHFTLGRTVSVSGITGPFRAFPKSLSVDFGGLSHTQPQPLPHSLSQPQQQQSGSGGQTTPPLSTAKNQDKYAAVSQLDSVFSDTPAPTQPAPPAGGPPQYSSLFGNRLSSSSTPASSPGVDTVSGSQTFANFPNPFSSGSSSQQPVALSPSNPFSSASGGDSGPFVTSPTSVFPPPVSFPAPTSHNAFHETDCNQEANGFASFSVTDSQPKVPRSMSVNPFTGNVYPSRGTSKNPFI